MCGGRFFYLKYKEGFQFAGARGKSSFLLGVGHEFDIFYMNLIYFFYSAGLE